MYKLDPIIAGENEVDHLHKMIEVLGSPPKSWLEGQIQLKKLKLFFPNTEKKNLQLVLSNASPLAINLLEKMLEYNPEKRITAKEILLHPYFKQFSESQTTKPLRVDRGYSTEANTNLKMHNSYFGSTVADVNKIATPQKDAEIKNRKMIQTSIITKFAKNLDQIHKTFAHDTKSSPRRHMSLKSMSLNYQINPLKTNMTPILESKTYFKALPSSSGWRQELANSNLYASNFYPYLS